MTNALDTYLAEINRSSLLSPEEELEVAQRVREGDPAAREEMIRANLRLVVSIARGYRRRGLPMLDLIEEGNLGLMKAVERFDPDVECRFSTYATWWIKQAIRRAIVNSSRTVRIPSYMMELITRWKGAERKLLQQLGRKPTREELCDHLELGEEHSQHVSRAIRASQLTNPSVSIDADDSFADLVQDENARAPEDQLLDADETDRLRDVLDGLDDREQTILRMRFGLGNHRALTLREIGERMGITRERVRQLQNDALERLQSVLADALDD